LPDCDWPKSCRIEARAGKLSTHALDTYHGHPAAGLALELWRCEDGAPAKLIKRAVTNDDGRTDAPLLAGDDFGTGGFELRFQVGDYFRKMAAPLPQPAFLEEVPVRFQVTDAAAGYHIPLLFSPWAYSTYRGS
jgi:5-hydroxyisourate hydrolase